MRLLVGFVVLAAALVSQAQVQYCSMEKVEREGRDYLVAADVYKVEYVQSCLAEAIKKDLSKTTRLKVLSVLAEIKRSKKQANMAALIKCETSGNPELCLPFDEGDEDSVLDRDAELKAKHPLEGKDW